ncbi:MAG: hypothetical protein IIA23_10875 [Chloroflexi bacterium]|nr:hypothetical protein [Chloroflexota bacterium]
MEPVAAPSVTSWLDKLQEADPEAADSCSAALTYLLADRGRVFSGMFIAPGRCISSYFVGGSTSTR